MDATFSIDCKGDVVAGDTIQFTERVFTGMFPKAEHVGDRTITARVLRDSYGAAKQQHTFTLEIIACDGVEPLAVGRITTRKGRTLHRDGTLRQPWADESARRDAAKEKHDRGDVARTQRKARRLATTASLIAILCAGIALPAVAQPAWERGYEAGYNDNFPMSGAIPGYSTDYGRGFQDGQDDVWHDMATQQQREFDLRYRTGE